jgi:putative acetyltransferase
MYVRRERPGEAQAIHDVHAAAFRSDAQTLDEPVEAGLADELRSTGAAIPQLSLVAVVDRVVVGHVVCSRGWIRGENAVDHSALGLGPIGVLPAHQNGGVGNAMMHAVLGAADALDEPLVALLGEPAYYARFGFQPAHMHDIAPPDDGWGDYFQVRTLTAHDPRVRGTFRYAPPFDGL